MSEELRIQEQFAETEDGSKVFAFVAPISGTTIEIAYQWKEFGEYGLWMAELSPDFSQQKRMTALVAMQNGLGRQAFHPIPMFDAAIERRFGLNNIITNMWIGKDEGGGDRSEFWVELLEQGQLQGQFYVTVYDNR